MSRRWLVSWGLAAVAFGGGSLIVPLYVVELGGDAFTLGVLFAASSFVGVPGALVFGNLADRTGKRRVFVLAAMATTTATMAVIPLLNDIAAVIVAYALLWLGFAAAIPVLTLLVVAGEPELNWSPLIARLNEYQGIGWALGLALGFAIIAVGTRFVDTIAAQRVFFFACAASAGVGLLSGIRTLPPDPGPDAEPSRRRLQRFTRRAAGLSVRGASFPFAPARFDPRGLRPRLFIDRFTPQLATYFFAVFLVFTGFGAFFAPLPAYLTAVGYGSTGTFALYLALNVAAAVFFRRAAGLIDQFGLVGAHTGGLLARGLSFPVIALAGIALGVTYVGIAAFTLVFVLVGLTWAVIAVSAATLVTTLTPHGVRGEALGVYGALVAVGGGVGGLVGGALATFGYPVVFAVAGGTVVLGASVVVGLARRWDGVGRPSTSSATVGESHFETTEPGEAEASRL